MVTKIRFVCLEMWRVHTTLVCLILGKITTKMVRVKGGGGVSSSCQEAVAFYTSEKYRIGSPEQNEDQDRHDCMLCVV